jgi:hypothetical protein
MLGKSVNGGISTGSGIAGSLSGSFTEQNGALVCETFTN